MARVEMASYIHDLVVYLRDSYHPPGPVRLTWP
jgi:hypothetical protein